LRLRGEKNKRKDAGARERECAGEKGQKCTGGAEKECARERESKCVGERERKGECTKLRALLADYDEDWSSKLDLGPHFWLYPFMPWAKCKERRPRMS